MYILLDPSRADPVLNQFIIRGFALITVCRLEVPPFDSPLANFIDIRVRRLGVFVEVGEEITICQHII